jgi:glycosyltransferase involved in cell wall biosynthesis
VGALEEHPDLAPDARVTLRGVAVLVEGFDAPWGPGARARALVEAVAARGVPVQVLGLQAGRDAPRRELRGLVRVRRAPRLPAGASRSAELALAELAALAHLRLERERLNLVWGFGARVGALAVRAARAVGLPAVVELPDGGPGGSVAAGFAEPDALRTRAALRGADRLIVPDDAAAAGAHAALGVPDGRLERLAPAVDLQRFKPAPWERPSDRPPRLLHLGPLDPPGRSLLEDTTSRLRGAHPELELVTELAPAKATRLLREADVLLLPTAEPTSEHALLEALACGVPVVAVLGGRAELLGGEAVAAAAATPEAFARAAGELLADPDLRAKRAASGLTMATRHDLAQAAAARVRLFEQVGVARDVDPRTRPARLGGEARLARAFLSAGLHGLGQRLRGR